MRPSSFSSATPRFYGRGERRGVGGGGEGGREGDIFSFFSCNGGRTRRVEANKREQQQAKNIIISNNESKKREMFPNAGDSGGAAFATVGKGGGTRDSPPGVATRITRGSGWAGMPRGGATVAPPPGESRHDQRNTLQLFSCFWIQFHHSAARMKTNSN